MEEKWDNVMKSIEKEQIFQNSNLKIPAIKAQFNTMLRENEKKLGIESNHTNLSGLEGNTFTVLQSILRDCSVDIHKLEDSKTERKNNEDMKKKKMLN